LKGHRNEFAHGALPGSTFNVNTTSSGAMALIQLGMIGLTEPACL